MLAVKSWLKYPTFYLDKEIIIVDAEEHPDSGCRFASNGKPVLVTFCQAAPTTFLVLCPYGGVDDAVEKALDCYEELFGKITVDELPIDEGETWDDVAENYLGINGGAEWLSNEDWSINTPTKETLRAAAVACERWQHIKVKVYYEVITPASCAHGDFHGLGERSVEEFNGLQEVYDALCEESADASSWPSWHPGTWYSGTEDHPSDDVSDGTVQYTFHLDKDLPEAWQRRLYDVVTA